MADEVKGFLVSANLFIAVAAAAAMIVQLQPDLAGAPAADPISAQATSNPHWESERQNHWKQTQETKGRNLGLNVFSSTTVSLPSVTLM